MKTSTRFQPRKLSLAVAASCLVPLLTATSVQAQQEEIEEIRVTGSLLNRPADRPQPVQIIDNETITSEFRTSVGEVLRDMPANQAPDVFNDLTEGDSPTTTVNLRGIGARATLPLLNGRRQTIDATAATGGVTAVDINNLAPSIMIQRIEVLTDGASATYGTDAVAGVVNFITRQDFEGAEISVQGVHTDKPGATDYSLGGIVGIQDEDTGGIVMGIEYEKRNAVATEDVFDGDRLSQGLLSGFGNPGSFQPGGFPTIRPDPLCGSELLGGPPRAGILDGRFCRLSLALGRALVADVERLTGLANANYQITPTVEANLEIGFSRNRQFRPTGFSFPLFGGPVVPADNPGVIEANRNNPEQFPIQDYAIWHRVGSPVRDPLLKFMNSDTYRVAGGLTGDAFGWGWDISATRSHNTNEMQENDTHFNRVIDALNCEGGPDRSTCYNPFGNSFLASPGDPHFNEEGIVDWMLGFRHMEGEATLTTVDALFTRDLGELPGGPISFGFGAQWREQDFSIGWDTITNDGGWAFNTTPLFDFGGTRDVWATFAELVLYPTDELEIQLASRYENYGQGVDSFNPKVSGLWTPTENLFIRASAGTSFRIPTEVESFGAVTGGFGGAELHGVAIEARGVVVGNQSLDPEEGENFNIGLTWDITDTLTTRFDLWRINFENLVAPEDGEEIFLADIADGTIDDPRISLSPQAGTNVVADLTANDFDGIRLSYENRDIQETQGIDFGLDWSPSVGQNDFRVVLEGTWFDYHRFHNTATDEITDTIGTYQGGNRPEWQANLRTSWRRGSHFLQGILRHTPSLENPPNQPEDSLIEEFSYTQLDLMYSYNFEDYGLSLRGGVRNVWDERTPINPNALSTTVSRLYDPRGRIYNLGFTYSL